jgi:hypothetical protein
MEKCRQLFPYRILINTNKHDTNDCNVGLVCPLLRWYNLSPVVAGLFLVSLNESLVSASGSEGFREPPFDCFVAHYLTVP